MSVEGAQEFTVEVAASPAACFDTIVDFERYPEWSSSIRSARVLERDRAGLGRRVEFLLDMRVRTVRYVLEYRHRKPQSLTWRSVDGDVESIEGAYRFEARGRDRTEVTCRQEIRLGFWIPGMLRRLAERSALRQSVEEFKSEVEKRTAATRAAKSRRSTSSSS
jgi:uncharacterized membrane protein